MPAGSNLGMRSMRNFAVICVFFGLAACDQAGRPAPVDTTLAKAPPTVTSTPEAADDESASSPELLAAFAATYGSAPPFSSTVHRSDGDIEMSYRPGGLIHTGDLVVFWALGEVPDGSHVDLGSLSVAYLREAGSSFTVVQRWPDVAEGRGFGAPPDVEVRSDLLDEPVLVTKSGWSGQGCSVGFADLIELTPQGPVTRATIQTDFEKDADAFEAKILPLDHKTAFNVTFSGTVISPTKTVTYRSNGKTYEPTTKLDDLPGC